MECCIGQQNDETITTIMTGRCVESTWEVFTRPRRAQRRPAGVRRLCPGNRRSTGHRGWRSSNRTYRGTVTNDLLCSSAARRLTTSRPSLH